MLLIDKRCGQVSGNKNLCYFPYLKHCFLYYNYTYWGTNTIFVYANTLQKKKKFATYFIYNIPVWRLSFSQAGQRFIKRHRKMLALELRNLNIIFSLGLSFFIERKREFLVVRLILSTLKCVQNNAIYVMQDINKTNKTSQLSIRYSLRVSLISFLSSSIR